MGAPAVPKSQHAPDTPRKKWRILVFMATESPALAEAAKADFYELVAAKKSDGSNTFDGAIVVQVHGYSLDDPQRRTVQRYSIDGSSIPDARPVANEPLHPTTGSIRRFLEWGLKETQTASDTLLLFWGHARGVGRDLAFADDVLRPGSFVPIAATARVAVARVRDVALGAATLAGIRVEPMFFARALRAGFATVPQVQDPDGEARKPIALLVFDSCFMANAEVAAEFQDLAEYMIASQTAVALPALDLGRVVKAVAESGAAGAAGVGRAILQQADEPNSHFHSLSLLRPPKAGDVGAALKCVVEQLRKALLEGDQADRILDAFVGTRFHRVRQFVDVIHLTERLDGAAQNLKRLGEGADAFSKALDNAGENAHAERQSVVHAEAVELEKASADVHGQAAVLERASANVHDQAKRLEKALAEASPDVRDQAMVLEFVSRDVHDRAMALEPVTEDVHGQAVALAEALADSAEHLSKAAASLYAAVQPQDEGFVVATRPLASRRRLGGVSLFCPWLRAVPREMTPDTLDVVVNTNDYKGLRLCRDTGWGSFAIGLDEMREHVTRRVLEALTLNRCCCGDNGARRHRQVPRLLKPHDLGVREADPDDIENSDGFDEIDRDR